jgi:hypothetical protein
MVKDNTPGLIQGGLGTIGTFGTTGTDKLSTRITSWLGDQESNLDSQIQNLMSYQLDDPQMQRAPAGQCLLGLFIQKADHSLPST